jgi:hypothetical protein
MMVDKPKGSFFSAEILCNWRVLLLVNEEKRAHRWNHAANVDLDKTSYNFFTMTQ